MMQRLVRGLVDLASLDAGTLRFSKAPTELRTLVQDAASIAAPLAATRRVQLTLDVAAMPPLILDRERLVWVLSTLLLSAVRLSGAGSTVTLRTERRDAELRFSIVGYRIFDRDFDRDFMPSPQGKGAALAPYLAKRLVEAQGGRICAARELEEGGAFWFSLPAIEAGQMELV
jgi:signal transduction histidine kinase